MYIKPISPSMRHERTTKISKTHIYKPMEVLYLPTLKSNNTNLDKDLISQIQYTPRAAPVSKRLTMYLLDECQYCYDKLDQILIQHVYSNSVIHGVVM